jgi:hypothetical protein
MKYEIIASRMGVTSTAVQELISGKVPKAISSRLKVPTASLQEFVDGGTSVGLGHIIGCTANQLQELRTAIGPKGAVGLLIGLCSRRAEGYAAA